MSNGTLNSTIIQDTDPGPFIIFIVTFSIYFHCPCLTGSHSQIAWRSTTKLGEVIVISPASCQISNWNQRPNWSQQSCPLDQGHSRDFRSWDSPYPSVSPSLPIRSFRLLPSLPRNPTRESGGAMQRPSADLGRFSVN